MKYSASHTKAILGLFDRRIKPHLQKISAESEKILKTEREKHGKAMKAATAKLTKTLSKYKASELFVITPLGYRSDIRINTTPKFAALLAAAALPKFPDADYVDCGEAGHIFIADSQRPKLQRLLDARIELESKLVLGDTDIDLEKIFKTLGV